MPFSRLALIGATVLAASTGANGLTNYLDRDIDARMERTRHRALPSGRISPPEKVLPITVGLVIIGLVLAWYLQPFFRLAFVADVLGTTAAVVWRKRATCVFPQGIVAGCSPVLIAWFAITPAFSWGLVGLCALIAVWIPLHVWSVMIANRDDYIRAGLNFFPMSRAVRDGVRILFVLSLVLSFLAIAVFFTGSFALLYLISASVLTAAMVYGAFRLLVSDAVAKATGAWRLYKLSSYPYLGLLFLAMGLDRWLG